MTESNGSVPLPPGQVHIKYHPSSVSNAQQPQSEQVASFEASPNDKVPNGSILDANEHFCVYAVKNGLIRVLHRHSTLRSLLRVHENKTVTDISFFQNGDVLGTVGENVFIWRIFENQQAINCDPLLEIPSQGLPNISRLIWHSFNLNQFLLLHHDERGVNVATLVPTTHIKTTPHPEQGHPMCQLYAPHVVYEGALQIKTDSDITDLCWSGRDSRHVMTAHADGHIHLWDTKETIPSGSTVTAVCKQRISTDNGPVNRCLFLPLHDNVASNYGTAPDATLTTAFVTSSQDNSRLTVWSPFTESAAPQEYQIFQVAGDAAKYNLDLCFGPANPANPDPPAFFLMLSDRSAGNMYLLALKSIWGNHEPKRPILEGFEYVVPFATRFPTYSWSVRVVPAQMLEEGISPPSLNFDICFYALQSKMVQQMTLPHYMCLPPTNLWDAGTVGVEMQVLVQSNPVKATFVEEEEYYIEEVDEDEDDDEDYRAPDPSSLPQPDGLDTPAPVVAAAATGGGNPFANWLGTIAAKTATPDELPPPAPPSTPATSIPMPPPGMVPPPMEGGLLSPMTILSATPNGAQPKSEPKKKQKSPKGRDKNSNNNNKNAVVPNAILKRDAVAPVIAAEAPNANMVEEIKKSIAAQFKQQEKLISNEVHRVVRNELQQSVLPQLSKSVAITMEQTVVRPMQQQQQQSNKGVDIDKILNGIEGAVDAPLKEAFTESMKSYMIPAFEAATREMFSQVAKAQTSDRSTIDSLSTKVDALTAMVQALSSEIKSLKRGGGGDAADQTSGATPAPKPQEHAEQLQRTKQEIVALLQLRKYEEAFTKALAGSSAAMPFFCCQNTNLADVLGGSTPTLSQPILLCLMQQLGAVLVMSAGSDLKTILDWLQEIALTLDPTNNAIANHVPSVLQQLVTNINTKMQQGDPALRRPLQMLSQVIRGMQR